MRAPHRTGLYPVLNFISKNVSALLFWKNQTGVSDLIMTPFEAMEELNRRRQDPTLQRKVEEYLLGDIPEYFKDGPILCLARHIATPNFETLRFKYLMESLGMKAVVSQDTKDLFVAHNQMKKALCKLSVCRGISQHGGRINEQFQNMSIADINQANGKRLGEIKTYWGENLVDFHSRLFKKIMNGNIQNPDDAEWISRHHRGNLLEHYKDFLSLFVTHGILFEDYVMEDKHEAHFIKNILRPACTFIEQRFGFRPLIVSLVPKTFESNRFWISYPKEVLYIVQESLND